MSLIYKPRICFTQCVITLFPEDAADVCVCVFASQAAAETSWAFNTFNSVSLQKLQRNSVITHHLNSLTSRTFSLSRLLASCWCFQFLCIWYCRVGVQDSLEPGVCFVSLFQFVLQFDWVQTFKPFVRNFSCSVAKWWQRYKAVSGSEETSVVMFQKQIRCAAQGETGQLMRATGLL